MKILTPDVAKYYQSKSLLRGHFVFTSFLVVSKKILFLDDHIERLLKGAHYLFPEKNWNQCHDQVMEFALSEVDILPDALDKAYYFRLNIFDDFIFIQKEIQKETPGAVRATAAFKKRSAGLLPSFLKVSNYLESDLEIEKARASGFDEVFYFDHLENLTEASTSNIFVIDHEHNIITPPASSMVLEGILRKKLLLKLKDSEYCITEKSCTRSDLLNAKEIWLTNSIKGIRLVSQYENKTFLKEKLLFEKILKLTGRYGELL